MISDASSDRAAPRRDVDRGVDYGWRASSSAMPRAARAIARVDDASLVTLRATMMRAREASRAGRPEARARRKRDATERANAGVRERAARDEAARRAATRGGGEARAAALEKKAALYDRLSAGARETAGEASAREYEVDFAAKAAEARAVDARDARDAVAAAGDMKSDDVRRELERRRWEREVEDEERDAVRAAEARRVVFDIERETERERDAVDAAKRRAREKLEREREKLRAAFARKRVAEMKAERKKK